MKILCKTLLWLFFVSISALLPAQKPDSAAIRISGYVEVFWAYDLNRPAENRRPGFLYSHNRHNEFNANLAYLKAAHASELTRATLALAVGTYVSDNYAAEPAVLKNILEANAGLKLGPNTWIDAGILPSHIGFESAVSKDCPTLTRSLSAENSPYFETGARVTHTPNDRWMFAALVLNGWQRIARINSSPAFGTQIQWKPGDKTTLNWSTYAGNERPDTARAWRLFQNFYGAFQCTDRFGFTAGFDLGVESAEIWFSPTIILHTKLSKKWSAALRVENYTDRHGIILSPAGAVTGASINVNFSPVEHASLRFETRYLHSDQSMFPGKNGPRKYTLYGTTSLAVAF